MRLPVLVLLTLILLGAGCTKPVSNNTTTTSNTPIQASAPVTSTPPPTSSPTASTGASDIYNHSVWLAKSSDGQTFTLGDAVLIEHASVPNITKFDRAVGDYPAGTLMIVYVDTSNMSGGQTSTEQIGRYVSTDNGKIWKDAGAVVFTGADGQVPVDPSLIQLPDGKLRLYYYDFAEATGGANLADSDRQSTFYAADSTDGATFTVVGNVFRSERVTDPEVVYRDGAYVLFFAEQGKSGPGAIRAATSTDGLSFVETTLTNSPTGIPGAIVIDDVVQLFGCQPSGVVRATEKSPFNFAAVAAVTTGAFGICDPDPVRLDDGSYLLAVKKM